MNFLCRSYSKSMDLYACLHQSSINSHLKVLKGELIIYILR